MSQDTNTCLQCHTVIDVAVRTNYFYTCSACSAIFVKHEKGYSTSEDIVRDAEVFSPILIGSRGKLNNESFTVKGCLTLFQTRVTVNLYSIFWDHGLPGTLIECDGSYSLIEEVHTYSVSNLSRTKVGSETELKNFGTAYCYSIDKITMIALKGEGPLFFPGLTNSFLCSFSSQENKRAWRFLTNQQTVLLTGKLCTFNELNLSPVRELYEWYKK